MRTGLSLLKEAFPDDWRTIALALGNAIYADDSAEVDWLCSRYFTKTEMVRLLDYPIAATQTGENEEYQTSIPAFLAVHLKHRNVLRAILRITKNPNGRKNPFIPDGSSTLLISAALCDDIETAQLLLDEGANVDDELKGNVLSHTALSLAIGGGENKMATLLLDSGATPTFLAAMAAIDFNDNFAPLLGKLSRLRPELLRECHISLGGTLLNIAVTQCNIAAIEALVELGADINRRDDIFRTPLEDAVSEGNLAVVEALVKLGADINAKNDSGRTPLDYAEENIPVAQYLKSLGAVSWFEAIAKASDAPQGSEGIPVESDIEYTAPSRDEVTTIVERLELLEEKFGIALSALYASYVYRPQNETPHFVTINFDVTSTSGGKLEQSLYVRASAYNEAGQMLETSPAYIDSEEFMGFSSYSIHLFLDQPPTKIRLFPST